MILTQPENENLKPEDDIQKLNRQVRDHINDSRKHYELRQNRPLFLQLCSSLDVIRDTEDAISAFKEKELDNKKPLLYLMIYGLLQAIYVQQDATSNLCASLGIPENFNSYQKLKEIREIRNDAVGHPTKRDRRKGQPTSYHHISPNLLSQTNFTLISFFSAGDPESRDINISEVIKEQSKYISSILFTLITNLKSEENKHKEEFCMENLSDIFTSTSYNLEKVFEGILQNDYDTEHVLTNLQEINEVVQNYFDAIKRRKSDYYKSQEDEHGLIKHAINCLKQHFSLKNADETSMLDTSTAQIFAHFLKNQVNHLRGMASDIDKSYAQ
jgi:hypothetical protein